MVEDGRFGSLADGWPHTGFATRVVLATAMAGLLATPTTPFALPVADAEDHCPRTHW
jgi:hypothetical protein